MITEESASGRCYFQAEADPLFVLFAKVGLQLARPSEAEHITVVVDYLECA